MNSDWKRVEGIVFSFASQAAQFPARGAPGLEVQRNETEAYTPLGVVKQVDVDCLLWRNPSGVLVGILYHYPESCWEVDGTLLESAGNVNVFVHPDFRRRGIARRLIREAMQRWDIDVHAQRYTDDGIALVEALLAEGTITKEERT